MNITSKGQWIFPDIKDWKGSHDEMRYKEDYWKLPVMKFIFFHPFGTKIFLFLTNLVSLIFLSIGCYFVYYFFGIYWTIIPIAFWVLFAVALWKKLKSIKTKLDYTLYDLFFREWT